MQIVCLGVPILVPAATNLALPKKALTVDHFTTMSLLLVATMSLFPAAVRPMMQTAFLIDLADWLVHINVGGNNLTHIDHKLNLHSQCGIFINGNMARILMAAHDITGNGTYAAEALRWCDTFVGLQVAGANVTTQSGAPAGYWADGLKAIDIYLGDAGSAATTALALGVRLAARLGHSERLETSAAG